MRANEFIPEADDTLGIADPSKARAWIAKVYAEYPGRWQNNHVMTWGEGDDQQFAMFDLIPSLIKKDAVEVKWFQAYPLRQGVGTRAMKVLQDLARQDGITLTLFPWDKGQVSQAKLTKFYRDQGFTPTVKGGKGMSWTPEKPSVAEGLSIDVPNEEWLQGKIDYAKSKGRDQWGAPFFGSTTAYARPNPQVSVVRLELLKGMRNEQNNVRKTDLEWLMAHMEKTGKLPPDPHGNEYAPYVMVAYNGEAWVSEGNHRIMAAYRLGWKKMPVQLAYFDGGERVQDGIMYPGKIGLGQTAAKSGVAEGSESGYKEIEFVCANPEFSDATDPDLQKQMYAGLKQIPGVIPLFQDQSDYSEGQYSLTAIYKDRAVRGQILKLAKQLDVRVDLEQPVTDDYVDRAIRGEHEGQQAVSENFADGRGPGRPGDSQRHGIPKHATMAELERASHAKGRKGELARWQLNMRRGKKNESK